MMGLAFRNADPNPVALGGKRHEDDEPILNTGQAISAKNHFFDSDIDLFPARGYRTGIFA